MWDNNIAPPLQVGSAADVKWDDEADVVVVGFGGAGAVTCLQSLELGASVIAIDRFRGGGATHYSGGVMYSGGTKYQREAGFNDTPEEMYKYLDAEGSAVGPATLRRFCEGSNADFEWIESFGVPRAGNPFLEKTTFPPDGYWIYYSGNEMVPEFAKIATPAPRGHRVVGSGQAGHIHMAKLREAALARGTKLITHAPVTRLVVDAQGRVIGVEANALPEDLWQKHDAFYDVVSPWKPFNSENSERASAGARALERSVKQPKLIRGRKGVVLSTGGFVQNRKMLGKYRPQLDTNYKQLLRLGSLGDDGSGVDLGQTVGGVPKMMDSVCVARMVAPPNKFVYGIMVNVEGNRFINEAAYSVLVGGAVIDQPQGGKAWLILQAKDFWHGIYKSFFPGGGMFLVWGAPVLMNVFLGGTRRASTLADLARKLGIAPDALAKTVSDYNALAGSERRDAFGKANDLVHPLTKGPFWAVNMSLDNTFAPMATFTMGGLDLDEETGGVKRADGGVVPGLYAAGRVGVGLCSKGYVSGLSIADTVFGGRRAARAIAGSNREDLAAE